MTTDYLRQHAYDYARGYDRLSDDECREYARYYVNLCDDADRGYYPDHPRVFHRWDQKIRAER